MTDGWSNSVIASVAKELPRKLQKVVKTKATVVTLLIVEIAEDDLKNNKHCR
jgi:hypothetical protein